jgi:urate oxidase
MAKRILDANPQIETVSYALPNKHNFSYDLERFGLGLKNTGNDADVFVPFSEPSGWYHSIYGIRWLLCCF